MKNSAVILIGLVCFVVSQSGAFFARKRPCPEGAKTGDVFNVGCTQCTCGEDGTADCQICPLGKVLGFAPVKNTTAEYPDCCTKYINPVEIENGEHPHLCELLVEWGTWTSLDCKLCTCENGEIVCEDKCPKPDNSSHTLPFPGKKHAYFPACCPEHEEICGKGRQVGDTWIEEEYCVDCTCEQYGVACVGGCYSD